MKKTFIACLAGMLFLTACKNENSSTEGSYELEETSGSAEHKEPAKEKSGTHHADKETKTETATTVHPDTSKTSVVIGKDSAGFENKKGTGVSANKEGVKVKSKSVEVDVNH